MITSYLKRLYSHGAYYSVRGRGKGTAAISFIVTEPLSRVFPWKTHPNLSELRIIVSLLKDRFAKIYIMDYRNLYFSDTVDFVFGFGPAFHRLAKLGINNIYYSTGASAAYQDYAVQREAAYVEQTYGIDPRDEFRRPLSWDFSNQEDADCIALIGNGWTKSTYPIHKEIDCLPGISLFEGHYPLDFNLSDNKDLLWVGSKGIFHKGIHIAAATAAKLRIKIRMVGIDKNSAGLAQRICDQEGCDYELIPFLDVNGKEFSEAVRRSGVVLGTSVSEGSSTAILTAVAAGAFSISRPSCGVDTGEVIIEESRENLTEALARAVDNFLCRSHRYRLDVIKFGSDCVYRNNSKRAFQEKLSSFFDRNGL